MPHHWFHEPWEIVSHGIVTLNDSVGSRVQGASGEEPRGPAVFSDMGSAPVTDPETQ